MPFPYPVYGGTPDAGYNTTPTNVITLPPENPAATAHVEAVPPEKKPAPDRPKVPILGDSSATPDKKAEDRKVEAEAATKQDHPRLITLTNRSAYTILSYWVDATQLHFITSQGEHIQVPLSQVERLYPRTEDDAKLAAKLPPIRR